MENRLEQRSVLKFLCKSGDMPINCWCKLSEVFGADTLSKGRVRVWHRRFREGDDNIKDKPKPGRPCSARSRTNCKTVQNFVEEHRNCTLQDVASEVDVSISSTHRILKRDLKFSKISPKFVPKDLTEEQKRSRKTMSQQNIDLMKVDPDVLDKVVTGDESWISVFELPTKQSSSQWHPKGTHLDWPLKALKQRSEKKSMLTVFFDRRGVILAEFSPLGGTVDTESYLETIRTLKERLRKKHPHLWNKPSLDSSRPFYLHHDNAPTHTSVPTLALLGESGIDMLAHPPYSPDLAPCDFYLFPRLKSMFRGFRHESVEDMEGAVKQALREIPAQDFADAIDTMPVRWMKCIAADGAYFEGRHLEIHPEEDHGLFFGPPESDGAPSESDSDED